jgi:hypothetical protein
MLVAQAKPFGRDKPQVRAAAPGQAAITVSMMAQPSHPFDFGVRDRKNKKPREIND